MLTSTRKGTEFLDYIDGLDYEWSLSEYDDFRNVCGDKEIIVFGAGIDGESTYRLLKKLNIDIFAFCDNNVDKQKSGFLGKKYFLFMM